MKCGNRFRGSSGYVRDATKLVDRTKYLFSPYIFIHSDDEIGSSNLQSAAPKSNYRLSVLHIKFLILLHNITIHYMIYPYYSISGSCP